MEQGCFFNLKSGYRHPLEDTVKVFAVSASAGGCSTVNTGMVQVNTEWAAGESDRNGLSG